MEETTESHFIILINSSTPLYCITKIQPIIWLEFLLNMIINVATNILVKRIHYEGNKLIIILYHNIIIIKKSINYNNYYAWTLFCQSN